MQKLSESKYQLSGGQNTININLEETRGLIFLKIETSKGIAVRQVVIE